MSQLLLTQSPYRQEASASRQSFRRTRITPLKWELQFGPMTLIVGLIVVAIVMSVVYLFDFNQVATKGYALQRLEADREQLLQDGQVSNMNISQVKSMQAILTNFRMQSMVKANNVIYMSGETALASADERS